MRKIKFLGLVVAAAIFAVSCQKGDAGPAGATGATGPAGPAGPAGAAGTANVIYSDWTDVTFTNSSATINVAQMTSDFLSKGEVKVYFNFKNADTLTVFPLPLTDLYLGNDGTDDLFLNVQPLFTVGKINMFVSGYGNINPSTYTAFNKKYFQYRYVLIPGGVKANSKVDWNNYSSVKTYLNLQN